MKKINSSYVTSSPCDEFTGYRQSSVPLSFCTIVHICVSIEVCSLTLIVQVASVACIDLGLQIIDKNLPMCSIVLHLRYFLPYPSEMWPDC